MRGKLSVAGLVLLFPLAGNAAEIKQRPFSFSHEVALAQENDAFVVCSNCPDDHLSILPAPPKLALRLSTSEQPQPVQTVARESEAKPKSNLEKGCVSCLLGTIHFSFDSVEITEKERSRLDELIRSITGSGAVNLSGYTCELGSSSHNMGLSLRRARGVASYLKGKGISVGKVEGLGKCCPVSDDRHLNRRVEITIQQKEEK
jgi:outer membrane protein OmpA-like peptidoglycan-associated protein